MSIWTRFRKIFRNRLRSCLTLPALAAIPTLFLSAQAPSSATPKPGQTGQRPLTTQEQAEKTKAALVGTWKTKSGLPATLILQSDGTGSLSLGDSRRDFTYSIQGIEPVMGHATKAFFLVTSQGTKVTRYLSYSGPYTLSLSGPGFKQPPLLFERSSLSSFQSAGTGKLTSDIQATLQTSDVFVPCQHGEVQWFRSDGTFVDWLDAMDFGTGEASGALTTAGVALDGKSNLYVTAWNEGLWNADYRNMYRGFGAVYKFDPSGTLVGTFGSGHCNPDSIMFDRAGNVYVSQRHCGGPILKFDSSGKLLATFNLPWDPDGYAGAVDLAPDQCTIFYLSNGKVKRFNLCANTPLPDFAVVTGKGINGPTYYRDLRVLPGGGLLLAGSLGLVSFDIVRLDATGHVIHTYNVPEASAPWSPLWYGLSLDPDGKSFWCINGSSVDEILSVAAKKAGGGDITLAKVYKFDIATGRVLLSFSTGRGIGCVGLGTIKEEVLIPGKKVAQAQQQGPSQGPTPGPSPSASPANTPEVTQEPGRLRITFGSAILFAFNHFELKPEAEAVLAEVKSSIIDKYPRARLIIEGHTDDVGTDTYNLLLSTKRAQAVADWLVQHGVQASRIKTEGQGKSKPKVPNTSEENRARNRRVEISVIE